MFGRAAAIGAICVWIAGIDGASASTISRVEMVCPYDGTRFAFTRQNSGTSVDKSLDLRPLGPIISPWPIAVCPTNGFVFLKQDYTASELEALRPLILSPEYQALKDETPYYRAAWIAERSGHNEDDTGWLLLRACWEAADRPAQFRRYAEELIDKLTSAYGKQPDARVKLTQRMLIGEFRRRTGQFDAAESHFLGLRQELKDPESPEAKVVDYQLKLIALRDRDQHAISEAYGKER